MKLSIIIVSWNVRQDIINCLGSIYDHHHSKPFEIIVIDNASSDGSTQEIKEQFPQVTCVANNQNYGFAGANNQGIKLAKGEYLLFLNPDTIVHQGALDCLIDFMDDNKGVGACGPKLLNEDGSIQRSAREFPLYRGVLYRFTFLKYFKIFKNSYRSWLMRDFDHKSQRDVDQLMGSALLVRKSIIDKIGGFDERFFMYYEETDWNYRAKKNNYKIIYVPSTKVFHKIPIYNPLGDFQYFVHCRNRFLFAIKNFDLIKIFFFLITQLFWTLIELSTNLYRRNFTRLKVLSLGLRKGLKLGIHVRKRQIRHSH